MDTLLELTCEVPGGYGLNDIRLIRALIGDTLLSEGTAPSRAVDDWAWIPGEYLGDGTYVPGHWVKKQSHKK